MTFLDRVRTRLELRNSGADVEAIERRAYQEGEP